MVRETIMSLGNLKDFLTNGAVLQTGPDLFKILIGPFEKCSRLQSLDVRNATMLYMPQFWDFMSSGPQFSQEDVYVGSKCQSLSREEFIQFLSQLPSQRPEVIWGAVNESQFRAQFDWSQENFSRGQLVKTVPIIRQEGESQFKEENLLWCLQQLVQEKTFGWVYSFCEAGRGFVGRTPEILSQWHIRDHRLHTVALAGTYPSSAAAFSEIQNDPKILHEHRVVIDDILNQLGEQTFVSDLQCGPTDVLELKHLLHLMTEIEMEVADTSAVFEALNALHPTAAMGLYPRRADLFLQLREFSVQKARGFFASPFVFFDHEQVNGVVAIRNLMFNPRSVQIFSGCGVTAASDCAQELTELQSKRDSVKKMLGLFS